VQRRLAYGQAEGSHLEWTQDKPIR
jgi:hypothetical protein